jgi:hypothetical protein
VTALMTRMYMYYDVDMGKVQLPVVIGPFLVAPAAAPGSVKEKSRNVAVGGCSSEKSLVESVGLVCDSLSP